VESSEENSALGILSMSIKMNRWRRDSAIPSSSKRELSYLARCWRLVNDDNDVR